MNNIPESALRTPYNRLRKDPVGFFHKPGSPLLFLLVLLLPSRKVDTMKTRGTVKDLIAHPEAYRNRLVVIRGKVFDVSYDVVQIWILDDKAVYVEMVNQI
jgi:hypothetical protein